ncbi:hypothetical protein Tco_1524773 [Tanacetum coccineum]
MDDPSQSQQHSDDHPSSASRPESGSGSKSSTWTSCLSVGNSPQNVTNLPNPQTESSSRKKKKRSSRSNNDYTKQIYYKYWIEEEKSYGSKEDLDKKVDELPLQEKLERAMKFTRATIVARENLSTLHFLKFPENSFEVLKIMENKLESMRILENKFESLKL